MLYGDLFRVRYFEVATEINEYSNVACQSLIFSMLFLSLSLAAAAYYLCKYVILFALLVSVCVH